ncbi:unnamed protein product [Prunus armeniaca]
MCSKIGLGGSGRLGGSGGVPLCEALEKSSDAYLPGRFAVEVPTRGGSNAHEAATHKEALLVRKKDTERERDEIKTERKEKAGEEEDI